jgi:DNA helicase HerA-like ATPase
MGKHNSGTVVLGMSGMGKSWMEGYLTENSVKQRVILDPKDEHIGLAEAHLLITREVMAAALDLPEGWVTFWRRVLGTGKSVRITARGLDYEENIAMVDALARVIHERGNIFFVGGEYHRVAPNGRVPKWVQILHTDARSQGIDYIVSSQRPALLDTTVVSQANRRIAFKMEDINDLKRASTLFRNPDPSRFKDVMQVLMSLPPRTCLYINADTSEQAVVQTEKLHRKVAHHG